MKPEDLDPYIEGIWDPARAQGARREIDAWPFEPTGLRVLDLAAGPGDFTAALFDRGASSVAWHDIEPAFLESAKTHLPHDKTRFELRDMMDLPYERGSFDLVVVRGALHWAKNEKDLLQRLSVVVDTDGWLVVQATKWRRVFAERRPPLKTVAHLISPLIAMLAGRRVLPSIWSFESLTKRRIERAGFEVVELRPPIWSRPPTMWFELIARKRPATDG